MAAVAVVVALAAAPAAHGAAGSAGGTTVGERQGDALPADRGAPVEPFDVAPPSRRHGSTVARIVAPTSARPRPAARGRGRRVRPETSWSRQAQVLLVLDGATRAGREWVKVRLAERPSGSAGWVPRDKVVLGRTRYWIDIRVGRRLVTVHRDGRRLRRFRAVVGASATPTPPGLAAVYERNPQPDPRAFLGPWVLSLTALSNVLEDFGGGPGRIGIHGRGGASLLDPLGSARSHGCVRVDNRHVAWMAARIPAGTPVRIRP